MICRFPAPNPRVSDASEPGFVNLRATEQFAAQKPKSSCLGASEPDLVNLKATEQFAAQGSEAQFLVFGYI